MEPHTHASQDEPSNPQALFEHLAEESRAFRRSAVERFQDILPRVIARFVGDGPALAQALQDGGFDVEDVTVVMRLNPSTDSIEFFADIGLPQPYSLESVYRTALEMNLCRTYPGIILGIHPESGRLVATTSMHCLLVTDDDACINAIEMLTLQVRNIRESRELPVG